MTTSETPQSTLIAVLVDRSGSMQTIRAAMEEALDGYLATIRDSLTEGATCHVAIATFDAQLEGNLWWVQAAEAAASPWYQFPTPLPIADVPPAKIEPRGGTALHDALVLFAQDARLAAADLHATRHLAVIITDGQENSSRTQTIQTAKAAIESLQGRDWGVVYLGANQDAFTVGAALGIHANSTLTYRADRHGTHAMGASLGNYTADYIATASAAFTDDDRTAQDPTP